MRGLGFEARVDARMKRMERYTYVPKMRGSIALVGFIIAMTTLYGFWYFGGWGALGVSVAHGTAQWVLTKMNASLQAGEPQ